MKRVIDVALQTNEGLFTVPHFLRDKEPPPREPIFVSDDIWVGWLSPELARKVLDSCEALGTFQHQPVRQYAQLYAFVREVPLAEYGPSWDSKHKLNTCIAVSRLIHPHTASLGYAARIENPDDSPEILPGPVKGHGSEVYPALNTRRTWLSAEDLAELKIVLEALDWPALPERIKWGINLNDYSAGIRSLETRWTVMCTALESLVHTDRRGSTRQFVNRLNKLALELGLANVTEEVLLSAYDLRSRLVHGGSMSGGRGRDLNSDIATYIVMENLLAQTLKRAILDRGFAKIFKTDDSVRDWAGTASGAPRPTSIIKAVRGTRDILPPDTALWQHVEQACRHIFHLYNFQEIRTPIFEDTQLFARGVGEETDIVSKEMFTWEDKARAQSEKAQSLTLRPENTAGVVRAYIEHKLGDTGKLQKLYYIGPQFRRERPQKGRYRQFYQIGAEVLGPPASGSESPARDAEIIAMLAHLLREVGIKQWTLLVNSVGNADDRARYNQALREALSPVKDKMCFDCQRRAETNPLRVLDCKVPEDQPIIDALPKISAYLGDESREHFNEVKKILNHVGIRYEVNERMVRGLDYYTRTTFEFTHGGLGSQSALLGGGRYDGLSEMLGGPKAPGIGFALGLDRFVLALQAEETVAVPDLSPVVFIAPLGQGMNAEAAVIARDLRKHNIATELGDDSFRVKKSFEAAERAGAKYILFVGENEVASGQFGLKNLSSGDQVSVAREDIAARLR